MNCDDLIPGKLYTLLNAKGAPWMFLKKTSEPGYYAYWFLPAEQKNKCLCGPMTVSDMRPYEG